jgi:hypothetical protein
MADVTTAGRWPVWLKGSVSVLSAVAVVGLTYPVLSESWNAAPPPVEDWPVPLPASGGSVPMSKALHHPDRAVWLNTADGSLPVPPSPDYSWGEARQSIGGGVFALPRVDAAPAGPTPRLCRASPLPTVEEAPPFRPGAPSTSG